MFHSDIVHVAVVALQQKSDCNFCVIDVVIVGMITLKKYI